jgi:hypothetical protein
MAMRKAPSNDENPQDSSSWRRRRRRREFDMLNDRCLLHIFSFLHYDDLNLVAVCNRYCNEIRSEKSLNQTRTGLEQSCSAKTPLSFPFSVRSRIENGTKCLKEIEEILRLRGLLRLKQLVTFNMLLCKTRCPELC